MLCQHGGTLGMLGQLLSSVVQRAACASGLGGRDPAQPSAESRKYHLPFALLHILGGSVERIRKRNIYLFGGMRGDYGLSNFYCLGSSKDFAHSEVDRSFANRLHEQLLSMENTSEK